MQPSLFVKAVAVICAAASLPLLFLWTVFAGSIVSGGDLQPTLQLAYKAFYAEQNLELAFLISRQMVGVFGGLVGWVSLAALAALWRRPWSRIPWPIKVGCLVGVLSALLVPAAPGLVLPPILLCAALSWLAYKRDVENER